MEEKLSLVNRFGCQICYSKPTQQEYFDIVVLRDKVAVQIREKKVVAIEPLSEYEYSGVPVINGRGFEVLVGNKKQTKEFLDELNKEGEEISSEFFNKWLRFETYRRVVFKNEVWEG